MFIHLIVAIVLLAALLAVRYLPIKALDRPTTRRPSSRNRSRRNRRRKPLRFTPGLLDGQVRPTRATKCSRCRGPILRGEDAYPTRNRRGLIGPCCYLH
ncbi:hypothetical protein [Couchioplanes caeruleus]|uniref:Uncharacterized protein n=2 Tax=Couchioplanes caeruleus TaxID=56438 RepID=A0A1K0GMG1_9ACTN|nr:hypothetical protein [Couchioplanes caeruleus]OJF10395.1 hypothetical protein BG844_32180 [Couchioplanes caeruleus subsp. caeruleus]ROP29781.1 hypothetical protein EDD30_2596 [Couchioplanes caeruleus]